MFHRRPKKSHFSPAPRAHDIPQQIPRVKDPPATTVNRHRKFRRIEWRARARARQNRGARANGGRRRGCRPNILARAINSPRGKGAARIPPKILHTDYLSNDVAARRDGSTTREIDRAYKSSPNRGPADSGSINRPAIANPLPLSQMFNNPQLAVERDARDSG